MARNFHRVGSALIDLILYGVTVSLFILVASLSSGLYIGFGGSPDVMAFIVGGSVGAFAGAIVYASRGWWLERVDSALMELRLRLGLVYSGEELEFWGRKAQASDDPYTLAKYALVLDARFADDASSREIYEKVIPPLATTDTEYATKIYTAYRRRYPGVFEPATTLALSRAFLKQGAYEQAARVLEDWFERGRPESAAKAHAEALALVAKIHEAHLLLPDAAHDAYRKLVTLYPDAPAAESARRKLAV